MLSVTILLTRLSAEVLISSAVTLLFVQCTKIHSIMSMKNIFTVQRTAAPSLFSALSHELCSELQHHHSSLFLVMNFVVHCSNIPLLCFWCHTELCTEAPLLFLVFRHALCSARRHKQSSVLLNFARFNSLKQRHSFCAGNL